GLNTYMVDHAETMHDGAVQVASLAEQYAGLAKAANDDYAALWRDHADDVGLLLTQAKQAWTDDAHGNYEQIEGMVAGIPSLADYDVWIDAGPTGEEDPANARDWSLKLPDGRTLDKPGNLFHSLTEPALWGTRDEFVGARVDLDGDGTTEPGEALPEANVLLGSAQALDGATADLQGAIDAWQPSLDDAFTALVVMIPTMSGYFEEWKHSSFVLGADSDETAFIANSRLIDVLGILGGLRVTYDKVSPLVVANEPAMAAQIDQELSGVIDFVQDLQTREAAGTRFTPEQADQFGSELQSRAVALAGQISQAAALLGIDVQDAA
ncbi:MAG TPA: imelysin family protein, partial [Thermomicrobiales bacterium]|nr:imelysin family protein [Thermomicrobiales bacterium]